MPLYNDLGFYYSPTHLTTPSYFSSPFLGTSGRSSGLGLMPVPRLLPPRLSSGYSPSLLSSIPEAGYGSSRLGLPSLDRSASPRSAVPRYLPPKPVHINTSDIDVSAARYTHERRERPEMSPAVGGDPSRQGTIKRGRTVVRLHTKKQKENPTLDTRRKLTPGEKLVQKFLILDKAEEEAKAARRKRLEEMEERERVEAEVTRLQAIAAKRAASDAESNVTANDGTFAQDPDAAPSTQNFPTIQGLSENAALDILLSTTDEDEEKVQGGDIGRTSSTGTVKKRKIKEKDGTLKAAKKKTKKKDAVGSSQSPAEDSSATGDEMIERSMLQRRNTVRFRRNSSDVDAFPEIEVLPGSRRSSFDQAAGSRRSSMDSTGDEIPLASEKKSTVKRKKGPKHKIVADVSVDNSPTREPRSPKFVVDEVKVEQSPASPIGGLKKFRYEVIVEDVEEENAATRRGKSDKENKTETVAKKKKAKAVPGKPLANRQEKSAPKTDKITEVKSKVKETTPKSFQKSRPESAQETKTHVADSKTDDITGKLTQEKSKEVAQEAITAKATPEKSKEIKLDSDKENITKKIENEVEEIKKDKNEKQMPVVVKDRKLSKDLDLPKLGSKDIQKGIVAVDKPKPTTQTSVVSKVQESKLGKHVVEKTKVKHQADPNPIPVTPTSEIGIQKSESGINFWDFLNGVEEEKEIKKTFIARKEPEVDPDVSKSENTKAKPNLHLNIQNKFTPSNKSLDTADIETKAIKLETKVTDQKEPKKFGLPGKTSEENVPKWKAQAKKTSETSSTIGIEGKVGTDVKQAKELVSSTLEKQTVVTKAKENDSAFLSNANKNETKCTEVSSSAKLKVETDDVKTKEKVNKSPETCTDSLPKTLETTDAKPVPKWKAFGKQPPSPVSPKEALQSPKPPAIPQTKNAEMKLKSPVSETFSEAAKTNDTSAVVPSPICDTTDGSTIFTIKDMPETPKAADANQKALLSPQEKEISAVEDPLKKKLLKNQLNKEGTPEGESKPVPKWKVKAPADKGIELKKPPLGKIKQSSSDSSLATATAAEAKTDASLLTVKTSSSEPVTPTSDKEKSIVGGFKTPVVANVEGKVSKTESKPPSDIDKPPKKPLVKNKIAAKQPETPPTPVMQSLEGKDNTTHPQSPVITDKVTSKDVKEAELKKDISIVKPKDSVPLNKSKVTEQKIKGEDKDTPLPLGKKVKVPEQKSDKKEDTKAKNLVETKKEESVAKQSKDEKKPELSPGSNVDHKKKDAVGEKSEAKPPVKKTGKLFGAKGKDEDKSEPTPLKKAVQPTSPKNKEESEPSSPVKRADKLTTQKSDDSGEEKKEPTTKPKKVLKPGAQTSKDEEKSEPQSPVKKKAKPVAQQSKEDTEPDKKSSNFVQQKSKEDVSEPTSPVQKTSNLPAQTSKDEEQTKPSSPVKKNAKLVPQKSKEDDKKDDADTSPKKGAKLVGQKDKTETTETSKKTASKEKAKAAEKTEEERKAGLPGPATTTSPTLESGSEADSEDSSSEDGEDDSTPRASSSSCSSSDSGFDSRPSSVPVPSTASEASSREPGSPSLALSCSPSLDPYSEDAGLPRNAQSSGRTTPPAHSLPRFRKYTVDDFQFLKLLGKGSFGKVLLAELRGTDRHYAVKCLKKDVVLEDDDVECTLIERKVLALGTKHPYLCHLFCTFQTESHLLFVMEYLNGGDLMFHIQQSGRFSEHRARFYAAEIVSGLKFLHKKGIVYRDLKLDNILLDYEGHVRIADFGMCKLQIFLDRTADTFCGTPDYMAPEIIKGLKYNQCVDWWSFGVLVFEMLVGVSPFTGCDEDELFWSICNDQPQYPRFLSREAHSLLSSLLEKDAMKRLGTPSSPKGDVPDHVFFRSVDWDALERRDLEPPFRPRVKHPLDVQYFDAAFTAERAELTPVDKSILQSMDQAQFQGFSYTNPNATD